jgi:hypothetical protein
MLGSKGAYVPAPGEVQVGPAPDPREVEDWFHRLDGDAQDLVRRRWLEEDLAWERVGVAGRTSWRRDMVRGVALVVGVHLGLVFGLGIVLSRSSGGPTTGQVIVSTIAASLVGLGLGAFWRMVDGGILTCALSACFAVGLLEMALGMHPMLLLSAPFLAGLMGRFVGLRRTELPGC